jgi:hypothetical protein
MAWQDEMIITTRVLINDLDTPYEFSDDRLEQILVVAGKYLQIDVDLNYVYTIDIVNKEITPDPTSNNDNVFTSLACLKAACIIDQSNLRTKAALEGIRTALGSANLSFGGSLTGWQSIIDKGPCALYEQITSYWDIKEATAWAAVLSPFVSNKFDPRYLNVGPFRNVGNNDFYS